jgi:Na+/H+ antiporter NhaC
MIQEASFTGVIRIIFYIILISFIIRLVARLALPIVVKKAEENMRKRADNFYKSQQPQRQEGDVKVESNKKKEKHEIDGEYVDYVEIKD